MKSLFPLLLLSLFARDDAIADADPRRSLEMNGFHLADFADFEKTWHMVTVRFRKDTEEMRVVYANELAWDSLSKQLKTYPDGAIFAKIGIATREDPAFPASATPAGARRYQFMVRDAKKFAATDGWGYALFDSHGATAPESASVQSVACAACHKIVSDRGGVFSTRWNLAENTPTAPAGGNLRVQFFDLQARRVPKRVREAIGNGFAGIRSVKGDLSSALFQGSLDEIRPILAAEVASSGKPAALIGTNGRRFSVVTRNPSGHACEPKGNGIEMLGIRSNLEEGERPPYRIGFCFHPKL